MNFIERMRFFILLFGLCATTSTMRANVGNIVSAGSLQLTAHEFGLNIACGKPREDFIINNIQLASGILRSIAVPVEDYVGDSTSRGASVTRAIIALTRFTEEVSYMLSHPQDDHTADLAWAITDAAMICKHLTLAVTPNEMGATDKEPVTVTTEELTETKSSGITPVRASALLEGICGVTSSLITTNNEDQKSQRAIVFAARSTMSLLRLVRNYYATPNSDEAQQQLYLGLIALQTSYAALKLSFADFAWVDATTGFNGAGYNDKGYNKAGFNTAGLHKNGTNFGPDGYDQYGFNASGYHKNGTMRDENGYEKNGWDYFGQHRNGTSFDDQGYTRNGFNASGIHKNGTKYDNNGYDHNGCDKNGKTFFENFFGGGFFGGGTGGGYEAPVHDDWKKGDIINEDVVKRSPTIAKQRARENLGVAHDADAATIKQAYRFIAMRLHPDKTDKLPEAKRKEAEHQFQVVNQANEILTRPAGANGADDSMPSA